MNIFSNSVIAGNENNPEIIDNDHDIIGPKELIKIPNILYPLFNNIDIISGWFDENPQQTDVLLISIKINSLDFKSFFNTYVFRWNYNYTEYFSIFNTHSNGQFQIAGAGYIDGDGEHIFEVNISIDHENKTITWLIPKNNIGNLKSGDRLKYPWIFAGSRFQNSFLLNIYNRELGKDITNIGSYYVIQY